MSKLKIEIYSDLIGPWCYIGKRRMEAGLKLLGASFGPEICGRSPLRSSCFGRRYWPAAGRPK
jgi:hypothetical protein